MTNFEKIKAMGVEEMAEAMREELTCGYCPAFDNCKHTALANCKSKIQEWLESEVEEDD